MAILTRRSAGTDDYGEDAWEWDRTDVAGALVRPLDGSEPSRGDAASGRRPDGLTLRYRIALPKGATPAQGLAHARVALVDRGMDPDDAEAALRVAGAPDVTVPCPTRWNVAFDVGRADG